MYNVDNVVLYSSTTPRFHSNSMYNIIYVYCVCKMYNIILCILYEYTCITALYRCYFRKTSLIAVVFAVTCVVCM